MNKPKYFLLNHGEVVGIVYESDKWGRTLVLQAKLDPNYPLEICTVDGYRVKDVDIMELIHSLLPPVK